MTADAAAFLAEWHRIVAARDLPALAGVLAELELQGIDLITLDAAGRVANLDVLVRPIDAMLELRDRVAPRMTEFFAARSGSP